MNILKNPMKQTKNIFLYYVISFFSACIFLVPIWSFFFVNYLKFSFGTALFITTFSGLISFIFEIPSGAWSDRFGRKITYIIGLIIILFGYSFYLWADNVFFFIISAFFQGIGFATTSGNIESLIHDSLIESKQEKEFKNISANAYIYLFLGRGISALVAGYLFLLDPLFPIYGTIFAYGISLALIFFLHEANYHKTEAITNMQQMKESFLFVSKNKTILIFLMLIFLQSGIGNIYWFTYQPYLKHIGFSIKHIGIIFASISFISAFGSYLIKSIQDKFTPIAIVRGIFYSIYLSSLFFYFLDNKFGLIPIILLSITFGFIMPLGNNFLSSLVESSKKATVLSIFSFVVTIGYFSFATISGFLVDIFGLKSFYFGVMIFSFFLLMIDLIYFNKNKFLIFVK
ncbi:MFS transporter [Candidatus Gracilibacteria bacterium]|nr:MFS transporter [Candidatus Gracilibacteria bacterium]NUJ99059.1 MFS transporter [Candidatus Gracilibacteria bacterium]